MLTIKTIETSFGRPISDQIRHYKTRHLSTLQSNSLFRLPGNKKSQHTSGHISNDYYLNSPGTQVLFTNKASTLDQFYL